MVDGVECVRCSASPHCNHGSPNLALQKPAVRHGHQTGTVYQRLQFGRYIGKISGRGENDAVCFEHFSDAVVYNVILDDAAEILLFEALITGRTTVNQVAANLNHFGFDAFGVEDFEDMVD